MKRREPFVMVESRILLSEELSIYEKMVYCVLCSFADNETGICYPSYETIAERAGCSKRKAIACVETLAKKGVIRKEERTTKNGGNRTNIYFLHGESWNNFDDVQKEIPDETDFSETPGQVALDVLSDEKDSLSSESSTRSNALYSPSGESPAQSNVLYSPNDEPDAPELDSKNYTFLYTPSIYPADMGRIDDVKERMEYDYFEEFFPEKTAFLDVLCVCILELYDEVFVSDRKLLNGINGCTILGFLDHIKGKNYSNVKNMKGYFKKMLLEYLRAEALLVATAGA